MLFSILWLLFIFFLVFVFCNICFNLFVCFPIYVRNYRVEKKNRLQQWERTNEVTTQFKNASNKKKSKFLKFDIVDIFPSITEELMLDSPNFAERYTNISKYQMTTIIHAKKFVLSHNGGVEEKKQPVNFRCISEKLQFSLNIFSTLH